MIRSLRLRVLVYTSTASAIVLGLLGFGLYLCMRLAVVSDFNQALLNEARAVAATAEQHGQQIVFDYAPEELPKFVTTDHPDYFEAWIDPGGVIRSPSLGSADLPRPPAANSISYRRLVLPDGRPGRMVAMSFTTAIEPNAGGDSSTAGQPHTVLLTVATETLVLHETLERIQWLLILSCGLAVVVSGALLIWIVGRAVRPVEKIARDIDQLSESDLSNRLAAPGVPDELQPVVEKLNGLLGRIESAFAREKAFAADVAHELRTPLAALLTTFDVCRARPRGDAEYIAAIDKSREVAWRMQAMIESLLILARADSGQLLLKIQPADASDLLDESWALFAARAEARSLHVDWQVSSPLTIQTDAEKLRIIMHNLLENAVCYADDSGSIRVGAEVTGSTLMLEFSNTGNRVAPGDESHLFDRFWRGDKSRTETGVHCGLGLSLCQRLARLLDGQIEIRTEKRDWFVVRLTLPIALKPAADGVGPTSASTPPSPTLQPDLSPEPSSAR